MHKIFAIEPEAINSWEVAQYLLEKFGYAKGVLVGQYPNDWSRRVIEACEQNQIRDIPKLKLIEKLKQARESGGLAKIGQPYSPELAWLANALTEEVVDTFALVIAKERSSHARVVSVDDREESWFADYVHFSPKRKAHELALAAKWVLRSARTLTIIDPYFQCRESNIRVLGRMLAMIETSQKFVIDIHVCEARHPAPDVSIQNYQQLMQPMLDEGWRFNIHLWKGDVADRHARFLITDRAGLSYDRGFDEPNDHAERELTTAVDCISDARIEEQLNAYAPGSPDLVRVLSIHSTAVAR